LSFSIGLSASGVDTLIPFFPYHCQRGRKYNSEAPVAEYDSESETPSMEITRPDESHWPAILAVLESANFHHIGGPEMKTFPLEDCFVALVGGKVKGVGGYCILSDREAKTTLLAVDPSARQLGLGTRLQDARLAYMRSQGIRTVHTNTDDAKVIAWLERRYGFRRTGETVPKVADFGDPAVGEWTSMRMDFKDH
jgi:ribosomal protein S18 acetylase RimI-like enzyme